MKAATARSIGLAFLVLAAASPAAAEAQAQDPDPPGIAARLSYIEGAVSLQPAGIEDWAAAALNRPLSTGDRLWSDQNSRAELDTGAAAIRLGPSTGFSFFNLDEHLAQMQLTAGTLIVRVRNLQPGQAYEVDTPNLAIALQEPGQYRVEVNEAGDATVIKVSEGSAEADGGGQRLVVGMQQMARFTGTQALMYDTGTLSAPDDMDAWAAGRERLRTGSPSREYVADDIPGTQDLDNNGTWQQTSDYGAVWTPTVVSAGNWIPYSDGAWAWTPAWGWTWVDAAAWGYAPFHYGRWVVWNGAWCWVPGPRRVRPVYAPAVVGWVGAGAGHAGGASGARIGWFALGPRDVYLPGRHVSVGYARGVNLSNSALVSTTDVTRLYQGNPAGVRYVNNRAGAVTAVPEDTFTSGRRIAPVAVRPNAATLAAAPAGTAPPPIVPLRQSVLGPAPARAVLRPPTELLNRSVVARTPPPRAPVPFERLVSAIGANGGRPLPAAEVAKLQPPAAAAPVRVLTVSGRPLSRPGAPGPAATAPPVNFTAREHALTINGLPSAPHPSSYRAAPAAVPGGPGTPSAAPGGSAVRPAARSDRPPAAAIAQPQPTPHPGITPQAPRPPAVAAPAPVAAPSRAPLMTAPPPPPRVQAAAPPPAKAQAPSPHSVSPAPAGAAQQR